MCSVIEEHYALTGCTKGVFQRQVGDGGRARVRDVDGEHHIAADLRNASPEANAEFDVAIIGIGPAGLSAAVVAKQKNLKQLEFVISQTLKNKREIL